MSGGAEDARWRQLTLGLFGQPPPSFDSFFAGANGEALRAVQHWAAGGAGPWCVLLWGAPGAGKSHLLQAALGAADAAGASCMYLPLTEALRHGAGLLDGLDALGRFNQQIHLVARSIPPETQVRGPARIQTPFEKLPDHPGLEERPSQRVGRQLPGRLDAQQPDDETGLVEVELGRLDETLVEVAVVRRQTMEDEARL